MCEAYIGAGLDPARFWEITPRLMMIEQAGAKIRIRREKQLVWDAAFLPYTKDITYEQFMGDPPNEAERIRKFHERWDRIDLALRH